MVERSERPRRHGQPSGAERSPAFHDLLLAYRAAAGETQDDLAAALGLQAKAIKTYERPPGHPSARTPPADVFARLCAHLREQGVLPAGEYAAFAAARAVRRRRRHGTVPAGPPAPISAIGHRPQPLLPRRLTALIGRDELVAQVCALAQQPDVALITLTGPGGIGKTHLALEVARRLRETASQKVWWVELAAVASAEAVAATMAERLGALEPPTLSVRERLLARLAGQTTLLVLDNFEHVLDAAPLVSDLLAHCGGLNVLVTSRTPLHLHGEQERAVPPLDPAAAGRLFLRRVHDLRPEIARTMENAAAIDAICARLDGVPLALELAARQVRRYETVPALLAALAPALPQLEGGPRDAPERQQTMRAAIAWSYALLDADAQELFRRLAICRGGCAPTAAQALGEGLADAEAGLAALVDQGLMQLTESPARVQMFEVVREFGLEQLAATRETDAARARHAGYYLTLAETAFRATGAEQRRWEQRLDQDDNNLRAALTWALEAGRKETALRLANALWRYWEERGYIPEAWVWLEQAFALAGAVTPEVGATALYVAARITSLQGDWAAAEQWHEQARAAALATGNQRLLAEVMNSLGGFMHGQGKHEQAIQLHEEALALFTALDDTQGMSVAHYCLGLVHVLRWNAVEAEPHYEQASILAAQAQDLRLYGLARFGVGITRSMAADWRAAMAAYGQGLSLALRRHDTNMVTYVLHGIAAVVGLQGDAERSARLFGAAARRREEVALVLPASYQTLLETTQELVRAGMESPEIFDEWYREGQEWSLSQTVQEARQCVRRRR